MKKTIRPYIGIGLAGAAAGIVNGLFGAGGGLVLVPLLTMTAALKEGEVFPTSVAIILPITIVSLLTSLQRTPFFMRGAVPYLIGSALGGLASGILAKRIPVIWLHRLLGLLILWGGFRYLC